MTTSGSVNFSINRDDIVKGALRKIGQLESGESPSADEMTDAVMALNLMIKAWSANGVRIYAQKNATLFLSRSQTQYLLGPTGDHGTHSYTSTTIRVAAAAAAASLDVVSTTGMASADYIGIVLTDGTSHWTTVSSVTDADTVAITTGIVSAAAAGNNVYFYRTKMNRPLKVLYAYTSNLLTNADLPMQILREKEDYYSMYDKTIDAQPSKVYYEAQLGNGVLYTNYAQTNVNEVLKLVYQRPAEDFDTATDTPDFAQEDYETMVYGLSLRLAPDYGVPRDQRDQLIREATILGINVTGFYTQGINKVYPTWF